MRNTDDLCTTGHFSVFKIQMINLDLSNICYIPFFRVQSTNVLYFKLISIIFKYKKPIQILQYDFQTKIYLNFKLYIFLKDIKSLLLDDPKIIKLTYFLPLHIYFLKI
jgi:hypothetical protein